jgi:hypothetical protein
MDRHPKSNAEIVAAMCLHLPDDPDAAVNIALVACATVVIQAGESDEAAIDGLRSALGSLRETGLGEAKH